LLARIIYRWRGRALVLAALLISGTGLVADIIPPFWRQHASLVIKATPGATVQIDGRSWPRPIYAGAHVVQATMPDGRSSWADITLSANQALTLTLPAGLAEPRERSLTPGGARQPH